MVVTVESDEYCKVVICLSTGRKQWLTRSVGLVMENLFLRTRQRYVRARNCAKSLPLSHSKKYRARIFTQQGNEQLYK